MNREERVEQLGSKLASTDRTERLWVKGANVDFPIYRAPVSSLYLNYDNRRFRAEAQGAAEELGRSLDPLNSDDDELSVMSLLLDREPSVDGQIIVGKPSKEAIALLADWRRRGQEKPFWIRPDGLVINGNRRLAMIKREQAQSGDEFSAWVEVIVFREDQYDDGVLFDLEAREQLTEGLKLRYSDINLLLTLREAAVAHGIVWSDSASIKRVAGLIQHLVNNDIQYAEVQLNAIRHMDLYLEELEKDGKYFELQGMVERFRVVGSIMSWISTEDASRSDSMLNVLFAAVQAGSNHLDLREIRNLLKTDPEEFDRTYGYVRELEEEEVQESLPEEEVVPDADDDEDDEDDDLPEADPESIPATQHYPKHAVKRVIDTAVQGVRDAKRNDKRAHVLSAAKRLIDIGPEDLSPYLDSGVESERLLSAIGVIVEWADGIRNLLETESVDDAS